MKFNQIDYKKYINRIYDAHYKECENDESQIDYEGILEEFIEKVKMEKFINKLFENNDSLFYFYSKEFIIFIKNN
jgi:Ca2+-binding EF-hand superfamily protein